MTATYKLCPRCGTRLHPVAGQCKACKADVTEVQPVAPAEGTHRRSRRLLTWMAIAIMVGVAAIGVTLAVRGAEDSERPHPAPPVTQPELRSAPWQSNM